MRALCGWFLQTSVPHIPKMVLCFWIFERGYATASIQLQRESGAQWKRALQASIFAGSWMRWKLTTQSLVSSSNVTLMSTYPNWNTWGLFNGTASFTGPRPPGRGVDMVRNTWSASLGTELSIAPTAWTRESGEPLSETRSSMPDFSANHGCIPPCGCGSRHKGLPQNAPGTFVFCRCPRVTAWMENKSAERSLEGEGIDFMTNLLEL